MTLNIAPRRAAWMECLALATLLLLGCGGGGNSAPDATPTPASDRVSSPQAPTEAPAQILPTSYRLSFIPVREQLILSPAELRPPIINARGQIIGTDVRQSEPGTTISRAFVFDAETETIEYLVPESEPESHIPTSISDKSDVAGFVPGLRSDFFTWSPSDGLARMSLEQGSVVYAFASEAGIVGGETEMSTDPDNPRCGAFTWSIAERRLREFPNFCGRWMNRSGVLAGVTNEGRLATVGPDGELRLLDPDLPRAFAHAFITDDGSVVTDLAEAGESLLPGAAFVPSTGEASNIGRGVATAPPGSVVDREFASVIRASSSGHVIGVNTLIFEVIDENCIAQRTFELFHWSPGAGAVPIRIEGRNLRLFDVNREGVVVGFSEVGLGNPTDRQPLVWTRETGPVNLNALVSNLPPGTILSAAVSVGDGGHIHAILETPERFREVMLTPQR